MTRLRTLQRLRAVRAIRLTMTGRRLGAAVQSVRSLQSVAERIERLRSDLGEQTGLTNGYAAKATAGARSQLDRANRAQTARLSAAETQRDAAADALGHEQAAVDAVDRALDRNATASDAS